MGKKIVLCPQFNNLAQKLFFLILLLVGRNYEVGRNFVGETEQRIPAPKNAYWRICALNHKVGEIDT